MLIIDRTSLLIKSPSKLFEFSDNLGSYLTRQLVTNASINYCITIWGSTFDTHLDPPVKLQKHAVRPINGVKKYTYTDPLFEKCNILKLEQNIRGTITSVQI